MHILAQLAILVLSNYKCQVMGAQMAQLTPQTAVYCPSGGLSGINQVSRGGKSYSAYMGIPYGKILHRFQVQ
jgi:hypothetical protein